MPFYEYKCADCGAVSEILVRTKAQTIACEKCGSKNLKKLLSTFSVGTAVTAGACSDGNCDLAHSCAGGG